MESIDLNNSALDENYLSLVRKFTDRTYLDRWNCSNCKTQMKPVVRTWSIYHYCETCYSFVRPVGNIFYEYNDGKCCHNPNKKLVMVNNGTSRLIREQCQNCGNVDTKAFKRDNSVFYDEANYFLRNRRLAASEEASDEWRIFRDFIEPDLNAKAKAFREKNYNGYINSERWREKRLLVLQRDSWLCQSCMVSKATEVHHLNYDFFENEPLFTLVSVCRPCHEAIEAMKKKQPAKKITHKI